MSDLAIAMVNSGWAKALVVGISVSLSSVDDAAILTFINEQIPTERQQPEAPARKLSCST
jgi:hypothetical protein